MTHRALGTRSHADTKIITASLLFRTAYRIATSAAYGTVSDQTWNAEGTLASSEISTAE